MTLDSENDDKQTKSVHGACLPKTSWTLMDAVRKEPGPASWAIKELLTKYRRPVYFFLRAIIKDNEEAQDLTQDFFTKKVLTGQLFNNMDYQRSFRPYLKQALRNFVIDWRRLKQRQPQIQVRPDQDNVDWDQIGQADWLTAEKEYHREWVREIIENVLVDVKAICEKKHQGMNFQLFIRHYFSRPNQASSWKSLANEFGLENGKQARNWTQAVQRHFKSVLRTQLGDELGSQHQIDQELATLLGLL